MPKIVAGSRFRKRFRQVFLLLLVYSIAWPASTQTWDLNRDFNVETNPSGAWSYGWETSMGQPLQLYDSGQVDGSNPNWNSIQYHHPADQTPIIWKNMSPKAAFGVQPGQLSIHPGPRSEPSVVRWTAPQTGLYQVAGHFGAGDSGLMNVFILQSNDVIWKAIHFEENRPFNLTLQVTAGEHLDFLVTGGYQYGNTPIDIAIKTRKS